MAKKKTEAPAPEAGVSTEQEAPIEELIEQPDEALAEGSSAPDVPAAPPAPAPAPEKPYEPSWAARVRGNQAERNEVLYVNPTSWLARQCRGKSATRAEWARKGVDARRLIGLGILSPEPFEEPTEKDADAG